MFVIVSVWLVVVVDGAGSGSLNTHRFLIRKCKSGLSLRVS